MKYQPTKRARTLSSEVGWYFLWPKPKTWTFRTSFQWSRRTDHWLKLFLSSFEHSFLVLDGRKSFRKEVHERQRVTVCHQFPKQKKKAFGKWLLTDCYLLLSSTAILHLWIESQRKEEGSPTLVSASLVNFCNLRTTPGLWPVWTLDVVEIPSVVRLQIISLIKTL